MKPDLLDVLYVAHILLWIGAGWALIDTAIHL